MESAILLIVAVSALGAFITGIVLLALYWRANRRSHARPHEPAIYGNLVQCPKCGYMNPLESAACLNCRAPLPRPHGYQPPPPYPTYPAPPSTRPMGSPVVAPRPDAPTFAPESRPITSPSVAAPLSPPSAPRTVRPQRPPDMPHAWLEGVSGAMIGQRVILQQADTLIGRSTVCDVQIYDPKVSRKHFRIRYGNGAFYLQDQQSSRGTQINGERVMAQKLHDGDRIEIGDTALVFHIEQAPRAE